MNSKNPERISSIILLVALIVSNLLSTTPVSIRANGVTITVPDDYEKIQWAIGNATEGDTIYVRGGIYKESLVIGKRLTIQGEDKETTLINATGEADAVYVSADQVEFFGLTVFNSSDNGMGLWQANGTSIHDCIIRNCSDYGLRVSHSNNTSIGNCSISGTDYGVYLLISHQTVITDCNITDAACHGIYFDNSHDSNVSNCTRAHVD